MEFSPSCFKTWSDHEYLGCSQEGTDSHYFAPRIAKAGFSERNAGKVLITALAEANGQKIRLGFVDEYFEIPDIGPDPLGDWMNRQRYDIDVSQYQG